MYVLKITTTEQSEQNNDFKDDTTELIKEREFSELERE